MTMLDPVPDLGWLDVEPIINAVGCPSRLGGVRYPPEVAAAMQAAGPIFYPIDELQGAASREIVALTGAEAGLVTIGPRFFLGACAILAGSDLAQIDALPDTGSRPNDFVVHRTHRSPYDHVVRGAGGVLREFGFDWEGTGTFAWQMEAAITDRTVGVVFQANLESTGLSIDTVCEIAHRHGLPVLVDAAEELPPAAALHRLLAAGADLIAVSGGKALMAPAGSGFLAGRKDLILSATMQCADMYVSEAMWVGPMGAREDAYPSPGHQGIGRMLKLGCEEIVGLIAAIRRYRSNDGSAEFNRSVAVVAGIVDALQPYRHYRHDGPDARGRHSLPVADLCDRQAQRDRDRSLSRAAPRTPPDLCRRRTARRRPDRDRLTKPHRSRGKDYRCAPRGDSRSHIEPVTMPPDALAAGLLSADWPETAPPAELDFIGAQVAEASEWMTATFGEAPVVDAPMLGQRFGRRVRIRFESLSPIRSFKARGALTFMSSLFAACAGPGSSRRRQGTRPGRRVGREAV